MKYRYISCVITPDSYTGIRALAQARDTTISKLFREALAWYLEDFRHELIDSDETLAKV